jgi:uncharacterized protein YbcV (DUF1398 family)
MNPTTEKIIRETADASLEGRIHFGQVVAALVGAKVESYHVDYRTKRMTYYTADGEPLTLETTAQEAGIAQTFSAPGVKQAILGAQRGEVIYPEFKKLSQAAGCVGYIVWLSGKHVTYFGRNGETHIEQFPK